MPKLPDKGQWQIYHGRGHVWKPPVEMITVDFTAKAGTVQLGSQTAPLTNLKITAPDKFQADWSIGGKSGKIEAECVDTQTAKDSLLLELPYEKGGTVRCEFNPVPPSKVVSRKPSLADKQSFFANVLRDPDFQSNGVLFGENPDLVRDCNWVVIDPNRHKLQVWQKSFPTQDFVAAGQSLKASVFTNGPMVHSRVPGNDYLAAAGYVLEGTALDIGEAFSRSQGMPHTGKYSQQRWDDLADDWFGGAPYGDVISNSNLVNVKAPPAKSVLGFFGRSSGTDFSSYKIGIGGPMGLGEGSGGLYEPAIVNYAAKPDTHGSNRWFFWGLAPIKATSDNSGLESAISAYQKVGTSKPVTGLIVGLLYSGNDHVQLLVDIGIKDAVKLDGSDSVLFGHDSEILYGTDMSPYKRVWMRWGFAFYPY
jgi:hypothetical protein